MKDRIDRLLERAAWHAARGHRTTAHYYIEEARKELAIAPLVGAARHPVGTTLEKPS